MNIQERLELAGADPATAMPIATGEAAAARFRLPFNRQSWRGQAGNWAGAGVGSSIDFQDHRPYVPGDDPRYINWQAYARSGHYTMKLYREEVRPRVDVVLDVSASMFIEADKALRALELFYFICHSAWRSGAMLNASAANGEAVEHLQTESLRRMDWPLPEPQAAQEAAPALAHIPFGTQSMRILISDFLFEQEPSQLLGPLCRNGSQSIAFSLCCASEIQPDWLGDIQLEDCESGRRIQHHFNRDDLDAYHNRYQAHFALWEQEAARHRTGFARISAGGSLVAQLLGAAGPEGAVELCN